MTNLGTGWGDGFADGDYIQHSYHWRDVLTRVVGSHSVKAGFEAWRGDDIALFAGAFAQPNLQYTNMIDLINDDPYSEGGLAYNPVTGQPEARNYGYKETTFGLFAEDTWKVNRKLTVNYGIRYDNYRKSIRGPEGNGAGEPSSCVGIEHSRTRSQAPPWCSKRMCSTTISIGSSARAAVSHTIHLEPASGWSAADLESSTTTLRWGTPRTIWAAIRRGLLTPTFYNNGSTAAPIFGYGTQNTYPFGFQFPAFVGQPLDAKGGIPGAQVGVYGNDLNLSAPNTYNWSAALGAPAHLQHDGQFWICRNAF